ncbi:MAG: hypothetical protein NUV54_03665 [Candidatus Taylorbacteria bacterium]|nr:hypothetical protein [Candidatus Taylorbacteria bacterium]
MKEFMVFLLREIFQGHSYDVGVIVAGSPEEAAEKIGRKVEGEAGGPTGQEYFDLTQGTGLSPYLTMNSMPEINSPEQLDTRRVKELTQTSS